MRLKVTVLSVVCLLGAFSANAQTLVEAESSLVVNGREGEFELMIENPNADSRKTITLELLDQNNNVRSKVSKDLEIKRGKRNYRVMIPLGGLAKGEDDSFLWYRLRYSIGESNGIISLSELIKEVFELRVIASHYVESGKTFRVRVSAINAVNSEPIRDVAINGTLSLEIDTLSDEDEIIVGATSKTDKKGFAELNFKVPEGVLLDDAGLKVTGQKNGFTGEVETELETPDLSETIFITIDKPLYQPGQKFNARALLFDVNENVIPNAELEFKIKDEADTLLYRETVTTSDFGIASISWEIPENSKLGDYTVEIDSDGYSEGGTQTFKVSRYDLPNFSVSAVPKKSFYLPDEKTAAITVSADYLFGKPVTKGKIRVVQESTRTWNWKTQKYDIVEKDSVEGETDADGKFIAEFDLSDEFRKLQNGGWKIFEDVHYAAYFTDLTTNRTEQRRFDVRISKEPIHVYVTRGRESSNQKLPVSLYVSTFYADGSPVSCDVTFENKKAKAYEYGGTQRIKTNSFGAGKIEFQSPPLDEDGYLDIKLTADDKKFHRGNYTDRYSLQKTTGILVSTDRTIYKQQENVNVSIVATSSDAFVYVDVVKSRTVIGSYFVLLKSGNGKITIPYSEGLKGEVLISAYFEDKNENEYSSLTYANRGIIFPEQQNLNLDAKFSNATYKPNEEATINFAVRNGNNKPAESALGVVVFDKAIEERARTDADFGSFFSRFFGWLGYQKSFGGLSLKDVNELDLSKPISEEMQLATEVMLTGAYYYPNITRSEFDHKRPRTLFLKHFEKQFKPVQAALEKQYNRDFDYPKNDASLESILNGYDLSFDKLRDPWGQKYRAEYRYEHQRIEITIVSAGADKKFKTLDDLDVENYGFHHFRKFGELINKAVEKYTAETRKFVIDTKTLNEVLSARGFDIKQLIDPWGREYRISFDVMGRFHVINFESNGENGKPDRSYYSGDDFSAWKTYSNYFSKTELAINKILSENVNSGRRAFPASDSEFRKMLEESNLLLDQIKDGYGRPAYVTYEKTSRYSDKTVVVNGKTTVTPVTEEIAFIKIRSKGEDGIKGETGRNDDFELATFSSVITERFKGMDRSRVITKYTYFTGTKGAIRGSVFDLTGAVIPGADVLVSNGDGSVALKGRSDESGVFLIENIDPGTYSVRISSAGFRTAVYSNVRVSSQSLTQLEITMEIGSVEAMVEVQAGAVMINGSSSNIDMTVGYGEGNGNGTGVGNGSGARRQVGKPASISENSTPRLRQYFPETLVWAPEILTDKNGRAELKFKMADNITTWKLYTVASTKNGKIGIAEREVQAFQPFFVDLEPPKLLTQNDEIYLPLQIRNYTDSKQNVKVSMARSDWFSFLNIDSRKPANENKDQIRELEVRAGDSQNAVFGFRADKFIKDGKQKVTAIASKDSDAIEKPVTVRPDGHEVVHTESKLFRQSAIFDVNFPQNVIAKTQSAELKIYPNLLSHVAESVEGLLQRPYGCGEQTISSTYPNLMILKFSANDNKLRNTAQKYLQKGYERLLGYQIPGGGFTYWGGKDNADIALTAYAIRFLKDARAMIAVDQNIIDSAENWLRSEQRADGSWTRRYRWETNEDSQRTKLLTSYIARTLAMKFTDEKTSVVNGPNIEEDKNLEKALSYLKTRNAEIDEPYALALYGLASLSADNTGEAERISKLLAGMAIEEGSSSVYWKLETNTPFYGWGKAGRLETTALVVQLLTRISHENKITEYDDLISRGIQFLLKNKDRYGVWYSTQTTINVLDAFLATLADDSSNDGAKNNIPRTATVFINGENKKELQLPDLSELANPINLELSSLLTGGDNRVEIKVSDNRALMSQVVQNHYVNWNDANVSNSDENQSRQIDLDYTCDKQNAKILENVTCEVSAERVGFKGYGMLLAEIGIPPGADVSRESLQNALESDWSVSRYEILPDRIVVYMWAKPGGTKFKFDFKPRYGINAKTPASVVYDYYNDEAKAVLAPLKFEVR